MVLAELTDLDYRSDECDEQTAQELYISAFFHDFSDQSGCHGPPTGPGAVPDAKPAGERKSAPTPIGAKVQKGAATSGAVGQVKVGRNRASRLAVLDLEEDPAEADTVAASNQAQMGDQHESDVDEGLAAKYAKKTKKKRKKLVAEVKAPVQKPEDSEEDVIDLRPASWRIPQSLQAEDRRGASASSADEPPLSLNITGRGSTPAVKSDAPTKSKAKKWRYHENSGRDVWYINEEDRFDASAFNRRYNFRREAECANCRQAGHTKYRCPLPVRNICFCCGELHRATRCKHLVCSTCKLAGHLSGQCPLASQLIGVRCRECNQYGHGRHAKLGSVCPDFWRRYHRTTTEGPPVEPRRQPTPAPHRVFCTNCGLRGHSVMDCSSWREDQPRPSTRLIVDYNRPPKSCHEQGQWPVGNRVSIPFFKPNPSRDYGARFQQVAQASGSREDLGTKRKNLKRSWDEANGRKQNRRSFQDLLEEEDEFDAHINRRKKRRKLAKLVKKQEGLRKGSVPQGGEQSGKKAKLKKWRLR